MCVTNDTEQTDEPNCEAVVIHYFSLPFPNYITRRTYEKSRGDTMNLLFMANNGLPRNGLVALYDMGKQIALGNTGQTLVDFSGRGNNAQLGSTAGADTNDPKYNGVALVGDGVDDYAVVPLASAAYRISVVDSGSGYVVVDEVPAYLNLFKTGASTYLNGKIGPTAYYNRVPTAAEIAQAKRYFKRLMAGRGVTVS